MHKNNWAKLTIVFILINLISLLKLADAAEQIIQDVQIEKVLVYGRATNLTGTAASANEGIVSGADLIARPMLKVAELLESMPGMVAVQHSGSGKANQYFLRGFNLDHGTDYSATLDGAPINLPSHGHGQGYLDVNGLIAESVKQIDYRKGPYYAVSGNFSVVGSSAISTIDQLDESFVSLEGGDYGWRRLAAGHSIDIGKGTATFIAESKQYDGPWEQPENLAHQSLWLKYVLPMWFGDATISLSGYQANWQPTEQIPERVIGSSVCKNAYCAIDDTAIGETSRWILNSNLTGLNWQANLYAQYYDWAMESNPTYDYQINQYDRRFTIGANFETTLFETESLELVLGSVIRLDDIDPVGLSQHQDGQFVETISRNSITESSLGIYSSLTWQVSEKLRIISGARVDSYYFDVTAKNEGTSQGSDSDSLFQPKISIAYAINSNNEIYANWGIGFHSNDARGVVNKTNPIAGLSDAQGKEIGVRATLGDVQLTSSFWWLEQESELIFIGDSNSVEPRGASEREGLELSLFWQPINNVSIDAVYTTSKARYIDNNEGNFVENALEDSAQLGFTYYALGPWELSARIRHLGPYALVADNSQRANSITTVNIKSVYRRNNWSIFAELINLFNSDGKDITYYYPAFVDGFDEPSLSADTIDCDTLDCTMSRATEPRSLRMGIRYQF
jgi:outer membrane cobalamin receptor